MVTKDPQSRIEDYVNALNRQNPKAFASFYAEDCSVTIPEEPQPLKGRDAVRKDFEKTLSSFPDMKYTLAGFAASGDTVAVELIGSGSPKAGPSVPKKILEIPFAVFQKINDQGLITEERRYYDMARVMQSLEQMAA